MYSSFYKDSLRRDQQEHAMTTEVAPPNSASAAMAMIEAATSAAKDLGFEPAAAVAIADAT